MTIERLATDDASPALVLDHRSEGDAVVVSLVGEVDHATAADLLAYASSVVGEGPARLVLDCEGLTFMDSSGLRVLVALQTDLARERGLVIRNGSTTVLRILHVTGLEGVVEIEPAQPEAPVES